MALMTDNIEKVRNQVETQTSVRHKKGAHTLFY